MINKEKLNSIQNEIKSRKNKLVSLYEQLNLIQNEINEEEIIIQDLEEKEAYIQKINEYKENLDRLEYERDETLYVEITKGLYTIDDYILSSYNIATEGELIYKTKDSQELINEINNSINSFYTSNLDDEEAKNTFINLSIYIDGFYLSKDKFINKAHESLVYSCLYDLTPETSFSEEELLSVIEANDFFNNAVKINPVIDIYKKYTENTIDSIGSLSLNKTIVNWNEFTRLLKESNCRIKYDIKEETNNEFSNLIEAKKSLVSPQVNIIWDNPTITKESNKVKKITL